MVRRWSVGFACFKLTNASTAEESCVPPVKLFTREMWSNMAISMTKVRTMMHIPFWLGSKGKNILIS